MTDHGSIYGRDIVKAIHIRFLPDATKLDNLCGPAFKDACTLELRNIVDTQEVTVDGKKKKVRQGCSVFFCSMGFRILSWF